MTTTSPAGMKWINSSALARTVRRTSAKGANLLHTATNAMSAFADTVWMEHTVNSATTKARIVQNVLRKRQGLCLSRGREWSATSVFMPAVAAMVVMIITEPWVWNGCNYWIDCTNVISQMKSSRQQKVPWPRENFLNY